MKAFNLPSCGAQNKPCWLEVVLYIFWNNKVKQHTAIMLLGLGVKFVSTHKTNKSDCVSNSSKRKWAHCLKHLKKEHNPFAKMGKNVGMYLTKLQFVTVTSPLRKFMAWQIWPFMCHHHKDISLLCNTCSQQSRLPSSTHSVDIHHAGGAAMPWEARGRLTLQMDPADSSQQAARRKWDTFQLSLHSPS